MHNDFYRIHLEDSRRRSERMAPSYHCDYCHANLLHVGPWGWPHFCKEITYMSMPVLRFEPFTNE
jgi:hypothetical protein